MDENHRRSRRWGTVGKPQVCPSPVLTGRHFPAPSVFLASACHRIDNIGKGGFLEYLEVGEARRRTALLSTMYRVARYFAVLEILYEELAS